MARYLAACAAFSALYLVFAALTSVYPAITLFEDAKVGSVPVSRIALCFWWGIALQHYVIDQRIWRIKSDAAAPREARQLVARAARARSHTRTIDSTVTSENSARGVIAVLSVTSRHRREPFGRDARRRSP